jgi:hypothetical protein
VRQGTAQIWGTQIPERLMDSETQETSTLLIPSSSQRAKYSQPTASQLEQLRGQVEKMFLAIQHKDGKTLDRILADDYIKVNIRGESIQKREFINRITELKGEVVTSKVLDLRIRVFGDVAVLNYTVQLQAMIVGDATGKTQETDVLVKRLGVWKFVSSQQTTVIPKRSM